MQELLGKELIEPDGLSLTRDPLHAFVKAMPDGTKQYAAIINSPLSREKLFCFLNTVSPVPVTVGVRPILADWELPEGKGRINRRLQKLHATLGKYMQEFDRHRGVLYATLMENSLAVLRYELDKLGVFEGGAEIWVHNTEFVDRFLGDMIVASHSHLEDNIPVDQFRAIIAITDSHLRAEAFNRWFWSQTPADRRAILKNSQYTWVFPDDQPGTVLRHNSDTHISILPSGDVDVRIGDRAQGIAKSDGDHWQAVTCVTNFVTPLIQWVVDPEGKRRFQFDFIHEGPFAGMSADYIKEVMPSSGLVLDPRRINPLIGLLALPYVEPSKKNEWPREVGLQGSKRKQEMGPAQIPVLALIRQQDMLDAPLLAAIEEHVQW